MTVFTRVFFLVRYGFQFFFSFSELNNDNASHLIWIITKRKKYKGRHLQLKLFDMHSMIFEPFSHQVHYNWIIESFLSLDYIDINSLIEFYKISAMNFFSFFSPIHPHRSSTSFTPIVHPMSNRNQNKSVMVWWIW